MPVKKKRFCMETGKSVFSGRFVEVFVTNNSRHEIVVKNDAVAFLVYNRDSRSVILVTQLRLPTEGYLIEAAAGHIEAAQDDIHEGIIKETMAREAKEEMGIAIDPSRIELISKMPQYSSPGVMTEKLWLGYMEIGNADIEQDERIFGLAEDGEQTSRLWFSPEVLEDMAEKSIMDMKTFAMIQWFLRIKYPELKRLKEEG